MNEIGVIRIFREDDGRIRTVLNLEGYVVYNRLEGTEGYGTTITEALEDLYANVEQLGE